MECEYIAHHINEDLGLEHLVASIQSRKVLGSLLDVHDEALKDFISTRSIQRMSQKYTAPAELDYEELRGLSDPGQRDCLQA